MTDGLRRAADAMPVTVKRWGSDRPLPERRPLRAGPVTAVLEGGDLRYVRAGGAEIVRRLYMAVRDRNWGTIEPVYTAFEVDDRGDAFEVRFTAEHVSGEVDFAWAGRITGEAEGTIRYELDGEPRRPFMRNRIGFCVLHPMELAGQPATVTTPDGTVEGAFPERISPHQPFVDVVAIAHPAGVGGRCEIRFEGDLFEMEDQRNWTDASYKTYCTPLRLPFPVRIEPGQRIRQAVTIGVTGVVPRGDEGTADRPDVVVGDAVDAMPPIGFGADPDRDGLTEREVERLRPLRPAHLWAALDLTDPRHAEQADRARAQADALGTGLHLEIRGVSPATEAALTALLRTHADTVERVAVFPPAADPSTFPRHDFDTSAEAMAIARRAATAADSLALLGGGTRANFTELNRAADRLPLDAIAFATYAINPQVHAFDNASLVETLAAQTVTVDSARAIAGGLPLVVGPVTLRQPFNPAATGPEPEAGPDALPPDVDPRQLSLFAAAWTAGSLHRLAAGTAALTYDRLTGWRGLMERDGDMPKRRLFPALPGQLFPLYHVFRTAAEFAGGEALAVDLADPLRVEALALRRDGRVRLLVANVSPDPVEATVALPAGGYRLTTLDETTYGEAAADPEFLVRAEDPADGRDGAVALRLLPYAVACLTSADELREERDDE